MWRLGCRIRWVLAAAAIRRLKTCARGVLTQVYLIEVSQDSTPSTSASAVHQILLVLTHLQGLGILIPAMNQSMMTRLGILMLAIHPTLTSRLLGLLLLVLGQLLIMRNL